MGSSLFANLVQTQRNHTRTRCSTFAERTIDNNLKVEKDFIKREIQKLNLLLTTLIEKISGLNSNNAKSGLEEVNEALKSEFDLTLRNLTQMENSELVKQVEKLQESHTEKLAELMYQIVIKAELPDSNQDNDK